MHDVIVVGGGFAGVTAAREVALAGRRALLLEAKDRLGGRTWTADWHGQEIEYGGGWVHWHQPHTWSEMTRGGIGVELSDPEAATQLVGRRRAPERHRGGARRDRRAGLEPVRRGLRAGAPESVPAARRRPGDGGVRPALDPRAHRRARPGRGGARGPDRGVRVARARVRARGGRVRRRPLARALGGSSLALTQYTGGRVTIRGGTRTLLDAIAGGAHVRDATRDAGRGGRADGATASR